MLLKPFSSTVGDTPAKHICRDHFAEVSFASSAQDTRALTFRPTAQRPF
jgi:hypothetical protein